MFQKDKDLPEKNESFTKNTSIASNDTADADKLYLPANELARSDAITLGTSVIVEANIDILENNCTSTISRNLNFSREMVLYNYISYFVCYFYLLLLQPLVEQTSMSSTAGSSVFSGLPKRYMNRNYRTKHGNAESYGSDNSESSSMEDNDSENICPIFKEDTESMFDTNCVESVRFFFIEYF